MSTGNLEPINPDQISSELDASYGTMIDDLNQPLILYKNRAGALTHLHSRYKRAWFWAAVSIYFCLSSHHPLRWWIALSIVLISAILYIVQKRNIALSVLPVLEMNSQGLKIRTSYCRMTIPWHEIKEARAFWRLTSFIGIVPVNPATAVLYGTFATRFFTCTNILGSTIASCLGVPGAPIELHATEFPISAEALAEQINLRRAHALQLAQQQRDLNILPPS